MNNFTIEDYKTAIRTRHKIAIKEDVSGILSDPTPAQLRDFYLRLLERGLSKSDEEIMKMFLEANESSSLKKTIENCNIAKFRPIISFLKGKNTDNKPRIEMAAILVNFQPRPSRKFLDEEPKNEENKSTESPNKLESIIIENEIGEKIEEIEDENENEGITEDLNIDNESTDTKSPNEPPIVKSSGLSPKKLKLTILGIAIVFCLGFVISYFFYPKKQCMQWSGDHYEKVDCKPEISGIGTFNLIDPFDENQFEVKKISVCDTTKCFKNGQAIIWYGKFNNQVTFFNIDGKHPENGKSLRPVTPHIFNKYKKKDCASK
ncbi:hypothetical protein IRZ71_04110 [Flavobacterium sp. ANB]|uniref:hypothetical protein n=1 Tax=unclassified Flavobacterium TaxID=196869 RepID=UPI0012B83A28|nr:MULTISPECIES: hypothetical protein [unclassified Flavobacterium]MBF4515509.1 hypothetical protein [Flavobacterium sp. ANB]MTD68512.1 hypothetical protein [Flavobacterium sp. LC2016-13]